MMKTNREGNCDGAEPRVYPALCEPELHEVSAEWPPVKRRALADKFERWVAQLRCSAEFIEAYEVNAETIAEDDGDAQLLELAAQLEQQAGQIRRRLGVAGQPKREGKPALGFLDQN